MKIILAPDKYKGNMTSPEICSIIRKAILEEIREKVPVLKENGGFIFSSDHSIPNSVSLENMKAIVAEVKRLGKY